MKVQNRYRTHPLVRTFRYFEQSPKSLDSDNSNIRYFELNTWSLRVRINGCVLYLHLNKINHLNNFVNPLSTGCRAYLKHENTSTHLSKSVITFGK